MSRERKGAEILHAYSLQPHREQFIDKRRWIVAENRKRAMSMRMTASDVSKIKKLARRLGVRDSDVIRFAVKGMLEQLWPLCDSKMRGQSLIPLFVESGAELLRFFEIDASRLESIINDGAETTRCVDADDIVLLALSGVQQRYVALKLGELHRRGSNGAGSTDVSSSLREYLFEKYVNPARGEMTGAATERLIAAGG
jgi:hypothetical protein